MNDYVGIACGQCDTFSPMGAPRCVECGHELFVDGAREPQVPTAGARVAGGEAAREATELSEEELMEQARNYVCKQCQSPVPSGHKFCGACGTQVPEHIQQLRTDYFGAMQAPGRARLILIRGDQGIEGLSYLLQGTEHFAGREDAQILFPDDKWVSPRHANFLYRGDKLVVRDEGSANGVYVRIKEPARLQSGDHFLCGEQVLRVESAPAATDGAMSDGTYFYSSPGQPAQFRVVQILEGGVPGMVVCAHANGLTVGREGCEMNFLNDIYMSGAHARIEMDGKGAFTLQDEGSRNGTYVRTSGEHTLAHGDYVFLGHQLLRVELT